MNELNKEELEYLRDLKKRHESGQMVAEMAALESKVAYLEYQNAVLKKFIEYELSLDDHIDVKSGKIKRKQDDESTESEVDEGTG